MIMSSGRMGNAEGEDNLYQTGQGDGLFLDTISSTLNREEGNRLHIIQIPVSDI